MSKPIFTTKHYKAIAIWLRIFNKHDLSNRHANDVINELIGYFGAKFLEDNSKFKTKEFRKLVSKS